MEWVAVPFARGSSWPRNQAESPALQADSLPSEPPGKPIDIDIKIYCYNSITSTRNQFY